ncbi:CG15861, partial [Drosophila busckii]
QSRSVLLFSLLLVPACAYYGYGYRDLNEPPPICSDYEMLIVNTRQCVRRCHIVCLRGICFENGTCPCDHQYASSKADGVICATDCVPGCKEAGGYCAGPELCICRWHKHYYFDAVSRRCQHRSPRLLDLCGGRCLNGHCDYNGACICASGYQLQSTLLHGQMCMPICEHNCGPRAFCFSPNMCACRHKHSHYTWNGICTKH